MGPTARKECNTHASEETKFHFYHQPQRQLLHAPHSLSGLEDVERTPPVTSSPFSLPPLPDLRSYLGFPDLCFADMQTAVACLHRKNSRLAQAPS